jgi:ADP-heptose:LPS heptosyltransferase
VLQLKLLRSHARAAFGSTGGGRWLDIDLGTPPSRAAWLPVHRDAAHAFARLTGSKAPAVPAFPRDREAAKSALDRLTAAGFERGPLVALSMSAGHPIRRWDAERFGEVVRRAADKIGFLVVIDDPDNPLGAHIPLPYGLCTTRWSSSLADLRALFAVTDVALCCDSGVMHMASASGTPVVAIFGPTSPEWYSPYGVGDHVVLREPMPCRPCFDRCIYEEPICMQGVTVEMVDAALRAALAGPGPSHRRGLLTQ